MSIKAFVVEDKSGLFENNLGTDKREKPRSVFKKWR